MYKLILKFTGIIVIALFMFGFSLKPQAAGINDVINMETCPECNSNPDCDSIFGDPDNCGCPAYWMQWILNIMKYGAIICLLVFTSLDFIKAVIASDKDALKKAGVTASKRFIYCVIIFFLPIIVDFFMSLIGAYGTCGIS